jgi:hypothetical protein
LNPRRSAALAIAFYPAAIVAGWAFVSLTGAASHVEQSAVDKYSVAQAVDRLAPSLTASVEATAKPQTVAPQAALQAITPQAAPPAIAPQDTATGFVAPDTPEVAAAAELAASPFSGIKPVAEATAEPEQQTFVVAALGDPAQILLPEAPLDVQPEATPPQNTRPPLSRIEIVGECLVIEPCIDQYLYALYERTPKEDTIKEIEKRKVEIKRKGKTVTVTRSFTKLVDNDFTWKDPKAARRVGMSMSDYVFGGMDRNFKFRLFRLMQAAENAGLHPGITSGFRDDYRQSIAAGLKAASNRSYHGGSLRGGYGHGLAADVVSVKGGTRNERWASSENFWKWIDAHGSEFGVGRPYLRRDPPHVGPTNGNEYASKRGGKIQLAASVTKTPTRLAARDDSGAAKRSKVAKSSLAKSANVKSSKIAASSKIAKTSKIASLRR